MADASAPAAHTETAKVLSKAQMAAAAVNNVINEIQKACQDGGKIKDRCFVGVITYGEKVEPVLGGWISEVATGFSTVVADAEWNRPSPGHSGRPLPVWVTPRASGSTPMDAAFDDAYALASSWIADHMHCFPPVVINITDGDPNDLQNGGDGALTREAASRLVSLATDDGNLLLFNAHISSGHDAEIVLPASSPAAGGRYAEFLFGISSRIPGSMMDKARRAHLNPEPGARAFVFNARRDTLVKLLTFGSTPLR